MTIQIKWKRTTEEKYWEMLEVLPPAVMGGGGFMVGEPWSHTAERKPTFEGYIKKEGKYYVGSRPMTITEFRTFCPGAADYAYSEKSTLGEA